MPGWMYHWVTFSSATPQTTQVLWGDSASLSVLTHNPCVPLLSLSLGHFPRSATFWGYNATSWPGSCFVLYYFNLPSGYKGFFLCIFLGTSVRVDKASTCNWFTNYSSFESCWEKPLSDEFCSSPSPSSVVVLLPDCTHLSASSPLTTLEVLCPIAALLNSILPVCATEISLKPSQKLQCSSFRGEGGLIYWQSFCIII